MERIEILKKNQFDRNFFIFKKININETQVFSIEMKSSRICIQLNVRDRQQNGTGFAGNVPPRKTVHPFRIIISPFKGTRLSIPDGPKRFGMNGHFAKRNTERCASRNRYAGYLDVFVRVERF